MADVEMKVTGLDDLQKKLEELPDKVGTKTLRDIGKEAGNSLRDAMVAEAPKDTGLLAEHIDVRTRKQRGQPLAVSVLVGPNSKQVIHPQSKGKTAGLPRTALFLGKLLEFGGSKMPKKPFMTKAWESRKGDLLALIVQRLKEHLGL